jgi:hypothetical protein
MSAAIGHLLIADRIEFPFFDMTIIHMDKYSLMTLTRVCRIFWSSLKKSAWFRKNQHLWRHVCCKCDEGCGWICDGQRLCTRHLPAYYSTYQDIPLETFDYGCACFETPSIINDKLCAACSRPFYFEYQDRPFDNCHCYIQLHTSKHFFVRYQNIVRMTLQDERIVYVHNNCNFYTEVCPYSYKITHTDDCHGVPKPCIDDFYSDSE